MKIIELRINSFKALQNTKIRLGDYSGLIGVEGRVTAACGSTSNGASKTALLIDATPWCLFGKPVQEVDSVDDVCNWTTGIADVEIDMELASGRTITVSRYRKGTTSRLSITGISGGTTEGKQESLEKLLGFDYHLYVRAVAFSSLQSGFCKLKDSEKKDALEKLLGLEQFAAARENAASNARERKEAVQKYESKLEDAKSSEAVAKSNLQKVQEQADSYSSRLRREISELDHEVSKMAEQILEGNEELAELAKQAENEEAAYQESLREWEARREKRLKFVVALREKSKSVQIEHGINESEFKNAKKELNRALDKEHPEECPTCGQRWEQDEHFDVHVQSLRDKLDKVETQYERTRHEVEVVESDIRKHESDYESMIAEKPEHGEFGDKWDELHSSIRQLEIRLEERQSNLRGLKDRSKENPYLEQVQRYQDEAAVKAQDIGIYEKKLLEAKKELVIYEFWNKGFGKQGIPSYLIDNSIPFLNEALQRMSSVMTDGALHIEFDPTIEGGRGSRGGQQLGIVVDHRYGAKKYKGLSTGEKCRVDICVLLAIRQLMATRLTYGFDQLFLDETFDGLDSEGQERCVALLRSEFPNTAIFVITHGDTLKSLVDKTIVIQKSKKGVSKLLT